MKCMLMCLIFFGLRCGCDILQKLEYLENKVKALEEVIAALESKVKASEEVIAALESKVKASEEVIAALESKVKASEEVIAALESKDQDKEKLLVSLGNNVKSSEDVIADLQRKVAKVEAINDALTKQLEDKVTSGTTYVRWGRTSCPGNGSELVYQGVAGGSHYTHTGAAANHLCMPLDPTYGEYYEDELQAGGFVYGTEYQLINRVNRMGFFPDIDASPNLYDQNVPCAVCHVVREAMIMVPAKTSCMPGWTLEYKGLIVTGYTGHAAASEYICLDNQPEVINGGQATERGKLLYFVEGRCGSLPCPPYVDGRELTCAVCTK